MKNKKDIATENNRTIFFKPQKLFDGQNHLITSPIWLQNTALACLCVYVYAWYLFNDFSGIFNNLLVLIGIYLYCRKNHTISILRDPVILLFAGVILTQLISWYLATQSHPDLASSSPKVHQMGVWFKMIPIAIILGGRTDRVLLCWFLALAALLSASFVSGGGISEWLSGLSGRRVDFGINNAQHTAMLAGVLLISLLAVFSSHINGSPLQRFWLYALLLFSLCLISALVVFTQTRAVWLGLLSSMPLLLLSILFLKKQSLSSIIRSFFIGVLLVLLLMFSFQDIIQKRFTLLAQIFESTPEITISERLMQDRSFFLRAATWKDSLKWSAERPLLGWGGNIEKHIVAETSIRLEKKIHFRHLHNSYLETLSNYGVFGLTILLLLCAYLVFCAHKSWRSNTMPTPIYVFLIGFLPFWTVINIFESYFYYSSGEYILAIVGGIILTYYWKHTDKKHKNI
ncbi:MAG: O-antigen ligase family protein [Cellvibrionaceae bacterium]